MNEKQLIIDHLKDYPARKKMQEERFDKLDASIKEVKYVASHNDPSPKTMLMFDEIKDDIKQISDSMAIFHDKFDEIFATTDKKYAIKLVERVVFGMIAMILIAFFGVIINSVIK